MPPAAASPPAPKPLPLRIAEASLERAWARGWATRPSLDPDALIGKAERRSGVPADDDASGWRDRLALLCTDLEGVARLTALGRTIAHGQLVGALSHRFRAQALWRRFPDILDRPVPAPIVVVGQMRSGTTRMQRLLACDPRLTSARFYESWTPIPGTRLPVDDRKVKAWLAMRLVGIANPTFGSIHATGWNAVDEEIGLQSLSVFGAAFEAQWRVPGFTAAIEAADTRDVYAELRRWLQTIAWLRKDRCTRPWVLKVPQYSQDLAALLSTFPDARVICLDREPARVIASSASLVGNQMRLQSDAVDTAWIEREWTRKFHLRADRTTAALAASDVPRVHVAFDAVSRDWEGEVDRVYRTLGMRLDGAARSAMHAYMRSSERLKRRPHLYAGGAPTILPAAARSVA